MTTLTEFPTEITAGDAYTIELEFQDYPASCGYSGSLYLRGATSLNVTGSANEAAHVFGLTSTATSKLTEGVYEYAIAVSLSGNRTTVEAGYLTVKPDLATSGTRVSHVSKMLSAITAVLENRVTDDVQSFSIAGRSLTNIPIIELLELRAQYTRELTVLTAGPSAARKTVPVVFNRP